MKKIKLIIFDIDSTLVYGEQTLNYYRQYPPLLELTLSRSLNISLEKAKEIADDHRQKFNGRGEKSFETCNADFSMWHDTICTLDPSLYIPKLPQVQKMLEDLKKSGYILGSITDGPTIQAKKILQTAGINQSLFSFFIGWERDGKMPKGGLTDVYKYIITQYKFDPSEILMVGDSIDADIIPAHACGINVLYINSNTDSLYPTISSVELLLNYLSEYERQ